MKKKLYMGFHLTNIWQILKCFTGTFHQACINLLFLKSKMSILTRWVKFSSFTNILAIFDDISKFCSTFGNLYFEKSSKMSKIWQTISSFFTFINGSIIVSWPLDPFNYWSWPLNMFWCQRGDFKIHIFEW